jgi:diaminopimelate decarboxylase
LDGDDPVSRSAALAKRFGTPLYLYDLEKVSAAKRDLFDAVPDGFLVYYAVKANPHPDVLREMCGGERGCRAEVSSTGELQGALAAGFSAAECLYTGPGKTIAELGEAVHRGVRLFSAESLSDLRRIGSAATSRRVVVDCLLRINNAGTSASTGIRMTGGASQFGIDSETLVATMAELTAVVGTRIVGMHFFPLSNANDECALVEEFCNTVAVAARLQRETGLPVQFLDIGGGFAAPYATLGERPVYGKLREELQSALDMHFPGWRDGQPRIACESGRYLVADAGQLVCSVSNIKESRGRRFIILDAGINALGGLSGLGRLLPMAVQLAEAHGVDMGTIVGPLCTTGDVLGRAVHVPDLGSGDVVVIPHVGAYGLTASLLGFLSRSAPAEVVVRGDELVSASRVELNRTYFMIGPSQDDTIRWPRLPMSR